MKKTLFLPIAVVLAAMLVSCTVSLYTKEKNANEIGAKIADKAGFLIEEIATEAKDAVIIKKKNFENSTTDFPSLSDPKKVEKDADTSISRDLAKEIALKHAELTEDQVRNLEIELDLEFEIPIYEISFDFSMTEYEYEIKAENGEIIRSSKEHRD